jgi:hypothetical protein
MSTSPGAEFTDMNDSKCCLAVEKNTDSGVWLCIENKNTGTATAVDLSNEDASRLGEFLRRVTAGPGHRPA